jgi:hypothetical protein
MEQPHQPPTVLTQGRNSATTMPSLKKTASSTHWPYLSDQDSSASKSASSTTSSPFREPYPVGARGVLKAVSAKRHRYRNWNHPKVLPDRIRHAPPLNNVASRVRNERYNYHEIVQQTGVPPRAYEDLRWLRFNDEGTLIRRERLPRASAILPAAAYDKTQVESQGVGELNEGEGHIPLFEDIDAEMEAPNADAAASEEDWEHVEALLDTAETSKDNEDDAFEVSPMVEQNTQSIEQSQGLHRPSFTFFGLEKWFSTQ